MRLLGGVFNHGVALGQYGGHHDVHGGADGHDIQIDVGAGEAAGLHGGIDVAPLGGNAGAQRAKALYVLVNGADAAEIAAAGHGDLGSAEAPQQRADEIVGRP